MSEGIHERGRQTDVATPKSTHAVGFVASEGKSEELARAVLRAREHNYEVFVTNDGEYRGEALRFADALGATVVELHADEPDEIAVRQRLVIAAEKRGCSGLLVNLGVSERIDYGRSEELLGGEEFCIEAALETEYSTGQGPPEILVGIPAYNEAPTIASVVEESLSVADEVLVVDDGSEDRTPVLAAEAGATVVEHEENSGYGAALQTTFQEAAEREAEHLVIIDADGQHEPRDIPRLVEAQQEEEAELVIGSRFAGDGDTDAPLYRRFGLGVVNTLTNLSLGVIRPSSRVRDTQSGFRAYGQSAIESLAESSDIGEQMSASTDILYHAHENSYDIEEVGTTITYEVESASSHNPVEHGLTLVKNILYTIERQRPITALGVPGFMSSFVGLGFGYWTFSNYISTGTFPLGLAIVSVFFVLCGVFASFTGIILHSLNQHLKN